MFAALLSNVPEAAAAGLPGANLVGSAGTWFANFAFRPGRAGVVPVFRPQSSVSAPGTWAPSRAREDWSWPDAGVRAGGLVLVVVCGCGLLELSARADLGGGTIGTWITDALSPCCGQHGRRGGLAGPVDDRRYAGYQPFLGAAGGIHRAPDDSRLLAVVAELVRRNQSADVAVWRGRLPQAKHSTARENHPARP